MQNCNFELLLAGPNGIVTRCKGCGSVQVCFECLMLSFSSESFPVFLADLKKTYQRRNLPGACRRRKDIFIKTPAKEVSMVFTLNELSGFIAFLEEADQRLLVKQLAREAVERNNLTALN